MKRAFSPSTASQTGHRRSARHGILSLILAACLAAVPIGAASATPAGAPPRPAPPGSPSAGLTAHPLTAAPGPLDNPLKGFATFYVPGGGTPTSGSPRSLTWSYFGLSQVMTDPSNCSSYNWGVLDSALDEIAASGNQAAIRFYIEYPDGNPSVAIPACFAGHVPNRSYNGVHNTTSPDYNNAFLLDALSNFIAAFGARYDGDARIGFIHLGLIGLWGEWHTWPFDTDTSSDSYPNYMPTDANAARIIQAYDDAFDVTKLELRYPQAAGGAADTRDIGYHDDSFCFREGSPLAGVSLPQSLGGASYSQLTSALDQGVENKWITNSMGGEVRPEIQSRAFQYWPGGSGDVDNIKACIELEHATWMINETSKNYSPTDANVAAAVRLMGYNLKVDNAYYRDTASGTTSIGVRMSNSGVAPFYYPWTVSLGLKNSSGAVVKTWNTSWDLRTVMPTKIRAFPEWGVGSDPTYLDYGYPQYFETDVDLAGVALGGYQLVMKVTNPLEAISPNAKKFRFANATQNADGWLGLGAITVAAGGADTVAPSVPTGLASTGQTSSSVSLSWSPSSDNVGVAGYRVLRNGAQVGTASGTSFTDSGLAPSTSYSYAVRAYDAAGNVSAASSTISVTTSGASTSGSYEAEAPGNTLTGTATVAACGACSGGSKVGYIGNGATLRVNGVTGGTSSFQIFYSSAVARTATVQVNGGAATTVTFPATADWNSVGSVTVNLSIPSGSSNTVTIANPSAWAPDIDRIATGGSTPPPSSSYEAEASGNTRTGTAVVAGCASCSGGSKVGYIGNGAILRFNAVAGGSSTVRIFYTSAVTRTATVQVNGGAATTVNFPATADWDTVSSVAVSVAIPSGSSNTVTIANPSAWAPDIDRITVG